MAHALCSARASLTLPWRCCCSAGAPLPSHSSAFLKASYELQNIMELRALMAGNGACALQRQGFLDAALEMLLQCRGTTAES